MDALISEAAELLARAQRVVVFTGAGVSAESGVPTFRDALTGLWARFDAQKLATPEAFARDPALVWGWYESRRATVERVRPNAGHEAIASIENCRVITQNIDDLHERAGSRDVIHLHGSLFAPRCSACGTSAPAREESARDREASAPPREESARAHEASAPAREESAPAGEPSATPPAGLRAGAAVSEAAGDDQPLDPPACVSCGSPVRPGVVWFGESLPEDAFAEAVDQAASCDLLITVGTSGVVYPAAEIPQVASRFGAPVIQVNPQPTPLDAIATVNLHGPAAVILPRLMDLRRHA